MKLFTFILIIMISNSECGPGREIAQPQKATPLLVRRCTDFTLTGKGDDIEWSRAEWNYLTKLDSGGKTYSTKFKILYSSKGIYVFFSCDDNKITTEFNKDFGNLFNGDVVEVFFHTDPHTTIYLEYEVNQLNKELVLLVPSINGKAHGWIPWQYENDRVVKKMVLVTGGENVSNATINSWSAELFFPYELFSPLANVPPTSGMIWNANFYRLDYDSGTMIKWAWSPVEKSFHELERFRAIRFE